MLSLPDSGEAMQLALCVEGLEEYVSGPVQFCFFPAYSLFPVDSPLLCWCIFMAENTALYLSKLKILRLE